MIGQVADFDDLFALETKGKNGAGVDVVHVEEILLDKSWVEFSAEIAVLIIHLHFVFFGHFNELIFDSFNLVLISWWS